MGMTDDLAQIDQQLRDCAGLGDVQLVVKAAARRLTRVSCAVWR
jgi:hypothetical protein